MPHTPVDHLRPVLERMPEVAGDAEQITERQRDALRRHIVKTAETELLSPFGDDAEARRRILMERIREALEAGAVPEVTRAHVNEPLVRACYAQTFGLGPLEPLLADDEILNITVTSPQHVAVERDNHAFLWPRTFRDTAHLRQIIETLALRMGRSLNFDNPALDLRLPDPPMRLHASLFGLNGPVFALRRGRRTSFTLEYMVQAGVLNDEMASFLRNVMRIPISTIFAGVADTGKTTFLETMIGVMHEEHPDRIITICEDTVEITADHPYILHLTLAALSGRGKHSLTDLVHHSLRCNTQMLVVGEVRSPEEANALLVAAPSMTATFTTLHGRTPREALQRLLMLMTSSSNNPMGGASRADIVGVVADLFPVVVLTDQLPDGRYVVREIDWIDVDDRGDFTIDPIFELEISMVGSRATYDWRRTEFDLPAHLDERLRLHVAQQQHLRMQHLMRQSERVQTMIRNREWDEAVEALNRLLQRDPSLFDTFAADFETALRRAGRWIEIEERTRPLTRRIDEALSAGNWKEANRLVDELAQTPAHRMVWHNSWREWRERIADQRDTSEALDNICRRAEHLHEDGHLIAARELLEQVDVTGLSAAEHRRWRIVYVNVLYDLAREADEKKVWQYVHTIAGDAPEFAHITSDASNHISDEEQTHAV